MGSDTPPLRKYRYVANWSGKRFYSLPISTYDKAHFVTHTLNLFALCHIVHPPFPTNSQFSRSQTTVKGSNPGGKNKDDKIDLKKKNPERIEAQLPEREKKLLFLLSP